MRPLLLTGISLRAPHFEAFLNKRPRVAWIEVHSEHFFGEGGKPLHVLEQLRADYPISLHGAGLSLGSTDELNWRHLKQLRELCARVNPCLVSDHMAWSSVNGRYLHDLLPLPYDDETLAHMVSRVQQVQDYLNRQILIENIASYVHCESSTMHEGDFLHLLAKQSGCGILLDVNNLYVSAANLGWDTQAYLSCLPTDLVQEIHLAGCSKTEISGRQILLDSHNQPVDPAVWVLYQQAVTQLGTKATIVEWDTDLPSLEVLCDEASRAEQLMREAYVAAKLSV